MSRKKTTTIEKSLMKLYMRDWTDALDHAWAEYIKTQMASWNSWQAAAPIRPLI